MTDQDQAEWKQRREVEEFIRRLPLIPGVPLVLTAMRPDVLKKKSAAEIGTLIVAERERRGASLAEAAKCLGVSELALAAWESAAQRPEGEDMFKLGSFLGKGLAARKRPPSPSTRARTFRVE